LNLLQPEWPLMVSSRVEEIVSEKENPERILETLSEGIIAHDRNRRIIFFNRSAGEITEYQRQGVIVLLVRLRRFGMSRT
jgi:PAS domain-containing protein